MKTITTSQSFTILLVFIAACGGSSSLGGGEESGGAAGSGGTCASCSGPGGAAAGGVGGTTGTASGGTSGKGTGGTATGGTGGSGPGGTATGGTGGSGTGGTGGAPSSDRPECRGDIEFADPAIEKFVAKLAGKQPPLRGTDVAGITEIHYEWTEREPLTSLRGLQCLASLRSFQSSGPDVRTFGYVDLSALSELPRLTSVGLHADRLTDYGEPLANLNIAPLARNLVINDLSITSEALADIGPVAQLVNLASIGLNSHRVTDLSPLAQLTQLTRANVFGRGITDITPLAAALRSGQGTHLTAANTSVSDWSPVATVTSLKTFSPGRNKNLDLSLFAMMPSLRQLIARSCELTQIAVSPSVTTLDISSNPTISSYEPLVHANVQNLDVRGNNITDLTPFLAISSFDGGGSLDVMENPLDCTTQIANIQALRSRGVLVYQDCLP
jgi:hypothetical protein